MKKISVCFYCVSNNYNVKPDNCNIKPDSLKLDFPTIMLIDCWYEQASMLRNEK